MKKNTKKSPNFLFLLLSILFCVNGLLLKSLFLRIDDLQSQIAIYDFTIRENFNILLQIVDKMVDVEKSHSSEILRIKETLRKYLPSFDLPRVFSANVSIYNITEGTMGSGTHIVIEGKHYILTCAHLFSSKKDLFSVVANDFGVNLYSKFKEAEIVALDKKKDLSLILLKRDWDLPYLEIAKVPPVVGDFVWVVGNPGEREDVVTFGKILKKLPNFYISDARIYFGNSGGAAINNRGEIVGVAVRTRIMFWMLPFHKGNIPTESFLVSLENIHSFLSDYLGREYDNN